MRGIEKQAYEHTSKRTSNRNSGNPREKKKADSLEVDCLQGTVTETNANGSTGNTHGGRDGKRELREDEDCDGS